MNNSGTAIKELIDYFKIDAKNVIVFHDDLDIDFGKVKLKLVEQVRSQRNKIYRQIYWHRLSRVRVGIGHPKEKRRVNSHVLEDLKMTKKKE